MHDKHLFWCAATLIEINKKSFVKRRFLQMLRQTAEELGLPDYYPLYLRARDLDSITKAKAADILSSFKSLVASLVPFLQREETMAVDDNTGNHTGEFQPRLAIFYSNYERGLEEYYKKEQFLELARLAELETYFRLGGIVAKLNRRNINYAADSEKPPKDFLLHYSRAMRLENTDMTSAISARNAASQLLKKTGSLIEKLPSLFF